MNKEVIKKESDKSPQNSVLTKDFRQSQNFFESDLILQHYLNQRLPVSALSFMEEHLQALGGAAAGLLNDLSMQADKNGPKLNKRDFYGNTIDAIEFHPAYRSMTKIAVHSLMFTVKWEPALRERFGEERHRLGFSAGFIFAMSESGLYCPLCMTDGVALLIDRYASEADKERLMPHIYTQNPKEFFTGAMFLTEKAGGSDVGANLVTATHLEGDNYLLNGEKWFCSNANAEIIFALARTRPDLPGTKGLGIFLIEPTKANGEKNGMELQRLKDKLGTRSMASGEYIFKDCQAKLIGGETEGFKIMADMINLSRLYNSVAAIAGFRRAMIESYQYLCFRNSFGKNVLEHALVRSKFTELCASYLGNFYMTWRAIELLDAADAGDELAAAQLRFLTPMTKKTTAENAVYAVRECMELMGGMGYIEDGPLPKIMRDVMVLPIWEGAGNIMVLDMLRAAAKSDGLKIMMDEMEAIWEEIDFLDEIALMHLQLEMKQLKSILKRVFQLQQDDMEATAKPVFEQMSRLYQIACLCRYRDEDSAVWIDPALQYYTTQLGEKVLTIQTPFNVNTIHQMMAWKF